MPYSSVEAKPIGHLCQIIDCEHKTAPYVEKSEFLVVRTSNVRDGQLVMDEMKFTTEAGYHEWTQRAIPEHGDVLFTREAPAGETCLVPQNTKVCMGQRMVLLRPLRDVADPFFLSQILATERCKFEIKRLSIGSTVSRINISDIKSLRVAAPPLPEQKRSPRSSPPGIRPSPPPSACLRTASSGRKG
jgi:Restriction endonuclease S subunits